ncbi:TonB-dependent receptor [Flagellimonas hymeniacidonis]|uniref:TonB-dependent receptor n=1 Tax=Flagellimonas hymeniacidonis TaxID=2603628 RepID=A0A5C8V326_9FLAO|nr:TonB-dependent receptor [Flagellimonas hymeniacidonis]TXN35549.1 TonB-dependent receptor [Flagellimonas hymeniacidonis]
MRLLLTIILLLSFKLIIAQNDTIGVTISFKDAQVTDVLNEIETLTEYRFYYVKDWLGTTPVSGNYQNAGIQDVLQDIFNGTVINYYILKDKKIALNRNNIIYDELPPGFFGHLEKTEEVEDQENTIANNAIFVDKDDVSERNEVETVRIGKAHISTRNRFTLTGYVQNKKSGEPIANLSIVAKNSKIGTVTDASGFYTIELPSGLNVLETSSLGIESMRKNVIIYNDGRLDFLLNESVERLEEVVVRADIAKNVEEVAMGTTEISSEETKNVPVVLGERNILKIATTLPGISSVGEGATGFNVRGGNADQNLVIMDNAVIYNPTHFFGIFQAINPFTAEDLKIYKGSIPAEYGGRLSSVFEITNKDGNTDKFAGEASVGPVTNNVALEIPLVKEKSALIVGGRSSYSDWILRSLDEESLKNSQASFYDAILKYNHKINDNNEIRATGYYSRDAFSITSDSLYNYSNRLFSLRWSHKFNDQNSADLILANSQYKFNIDFDGETNTDFGFGYKVNETHLKYRMRYLLNEKHKFDYGISSKLYAVNPGDIDPEGNESIIEPQSIPKERALETALFFSDTYEFSERLLLDLGFRYSAYFALGASVQRVYEDGLPKEEGTLVESVEYDNNEIIKTYTGPEVRVSGRYFLGKDFSIKGSFNSTYQYIHTLSNNTTVSPIDTWKLSDLNIEPQRANQFSLGLYKNFDDHNFELSLEGYYKRSKNNLDFKVAAELLLNETIETEVLQGEGKAYGVEFLLKKNRGKFNGWLGYTYSRSFIKLDSEFAEELVNDGAYFPSNFDKPHDLSLVANYKFTKRFSLSTNFVYQTGRPVTYPIGNYTFRGADYAFYSDRNKFRIPNYYRLDLSFNVEGNHKLEKLAHSFWNISIYNVLGRNNPYSVFFITESGEIEAYKSSIFSIPIPTITYNFKF